MMCWRRSGFLFPETDLHVLAGCCLVQVSAEDGTLSMHDQLRDLAYSIVREEGSSVAQRSRLLGGDAELVMKLGVRNQVVQASVAFGIASALHMELQQVCDKLQQ